MPTQKYHDKIERAKEFKNKIEKICWSIERPIKYFFQRIKRGGWDDSETWNLDWSLSKLILPRLKRFKEKNNGIPAEVGTEEKWNEILDKMIFSFQSIVDGAEDEIDFPFSLDIKPQDWKKDEKGRTYLPHKEKTPQEQKDWDEYSSKRIELGKKIQEGLDLFGKYFRGLWW